jgi:hypothetical protein
VLLNKAHHLTSREHLRLLGVHEPNGHHEQKNSSHFQSPSYRPFKAHLPPVAITDLAMNFAQATIPLL